MTPEQETQVRAIQATAHALAMQCEALLSGHEAQILGAAESVADVLEFQQPQRPKAFNRKSETPDPAA